MPNINSFVVFLLFLYINDGDKRGKKPLYVNFWFKCRASFLGTCSCHPLYIDDGGIRGKIPVFLYDNFLVKSRGPLFIQANVIPHRKLIHIHGSGLQKYGVRIK